MIKIVSILQKSIAFILATMLIFLLWQNGNLKEDLANTQAKLKQVCKEKADYKVLYEKSLDGAKSLQILANKALIREQKAFVNEVERKVILNNIRAILPKNKENLEDIINEEIIDDETHKKVVTRLNRPL